MRRLIPAVACLLLLTACGAKDGDRDADINNPISLDIAASATFIIPWLVGQQNGFFEARGVKVENVIAGDGGSSTLRSGLSGGSPIAEVSFPAVLDAVQQGADLEVISGSLNTSVGVDFYARANNVAVNRMEDVTKLGITNPGSVSETVATLAIEDLGLEPKPKLTPTGGVGEGVALLESGDVDATFIPTLVAAGMQDRIKPILQASEQVGAIQTSVIVVTAEYAESHPGAVKAILQGFQDSVDKIAADPAQAARIYADYFDVPLEVGRALVDRTAASPVPVWNLGFDTGSLQRASQAMTLTGRGRDIDYCSTLTGKYLPAGAPIGPLESC